MLHGSGGSQSMKIVTVTLNPAIDQTVQVDYLRPNTVNYQTYFQRVSIYTLADVPRSVS